VPKVFLIEGEDLGAVLNDKDCRDEIIKVVQFCESVVCCRATPKQKAQVVGLIK
jgi:magnesium-transporting ATPase (P-type)